MTYRKHGNVWQVRRHVRAIVKDKAEAIRLERLMDSAIALARRRHREDVSGCCSIRNKLDEFLDDSRIGLGRRRIHQKTIDRHRRRLLAFNLFFQGKPLDAIDRDRVERWIKKRLKEVDADTVEADLVSLRAFARWAQRKKYAPDILPLLSVERLRTPGKMPGKNRKLPKAVGMGRMFEVIKAVRECRPDIFLFLMGMAHFGLRPENVGGLRRENVTLPTKSEPGRLFVRGIKGVLDRWVSIASGTLAERWMRECLALGKRLGRNKPSAPLVPSISGRSRLNPGGWTTGALDMALARLFSQMKIELTPYHIRHSCMTYLARCKKLSPADLKKFAGHSRMETQNIYVDLLGDEDQASYGEMEKAMREHGAYPE